jgi:hypothetical protein
MSDDLSSPFVFVPAGEKVPDQVRGPGWVRVPATFVPRDGGGVSSTGQPWPRDSADRALAKDRSGRPICPLDELPPGAPKPGEGTLKAEDPVATFLAMDEVLQDPAGSASKLLNLTGGNGQAAAPKPSPVPNAPAVPDCSGPQVPPPPEQQPV